MKVFKFGGGCIQQPEAVKKLEQLIRSEPFRPLVIVISAMGKTTSSLEMIFQQRLNKQPYDIALQQLYRFYQGVIDALLHQARQEAYQVLELWREELITTLSPPPTDLSLDKLYSKIVAEGELLTSKLVYCYLQEQHMACTWLDARKCIKTNKGFSNAQVDWVATQHWTKTSIIPLLNENQIVLTQGFIGSDEVGKTTTLGKEGSDFTSAILASVLGAQSVTIWKDVPGIMNADPKLFREAIKLDRISYKAVAEMAFYGAKVLHPKTVQPLEAHNIPLYIKPFHYPHETGTEIANKWDQPGHPIYILQKDQGLVHLSRKTSAFFDEVCLQEVLYQLIQHDTPANILEKHAYTLSICLNTGSYKLNKLLTTLRQKFRVHYHAPVHLLTVVHQNDQLLQRLLHLKTALLAQKKEHIYQAAFRPEEEIAANIDNMLSAY